MILVLLLAVPLAVLLTGGLSRRRLTRLRADEATHPGLHRLGRVTVGARRIGVALGLVLALVAAAVLPLGRGVLLAPALFSLGILLCLVAGQALVWRAARTPGVAALESRSSTRYLPRSAGGGLALALAALLGLALWCRDHQNTEADEMGTVGRQYVHHDNATQWGSTGPFPGTWYTLPIGVALVACLVLLGFGLLLVVRRPRNGADPVVVAVDEQARQRDAEAMVAAGVLGAAGSLLGCAALAAVIVGQYLPWGSIMLAAVAVLALLGCAWAASVLLVAGTPRPAEPTLATASSEAAR